MTDNASDDRVVSRGCKPISAAQIRWQTQRRAEFTSPPAFPKPCPKSPPSIAAPSWRTSAALGSEARFFPVSFGPGGPAASFRDFERDDRRRRRDRRPLVQRRTACRARAGPARPQVGDAGAVKRTRDTRPGTRDKGSRNSTPRTADSPSSVSPCPVSRVPSPVPPLTKVLHRRKNTSGAFGV